VAHRLSALRVQRFSPVERFTLPEWPQQKITLPPFLHVLEAF
jgi:hypothetical protein